MALDVRAVTMQHLPRPRGAVRQFLFDMTTGDLEGDGEVWAGGWDGNTFCEIFRDTLEERTGQWADAHDIGRDGRDALQGWIDSLPWRGDVITFYLRV